MDEVFSGGASQNQTRPVQTVEILALRAHFNMVARGMNPFGVCRAPPARGVPETADVVAQLFKKVEERCHFF